MIDEIGRRGREEEEGTASWAPAGGDEDIDCSVVQMVIT